MYIKYSEKTDSNLSTTQIEELYAQGFVFTRLAKGNLQQTRSVRINLADFKLTSENKRILRKNDNLKIIAHKLPFENYVWQIHKMGKDFYTQRFGSKTMSANKIKNLFTEPETENFNTAFEYQKNDESVGYAVCFDTDKILHYAYPFYNLQAAQDNIGLGMMLLAIQFAKEEKLEYIYLGSANTEKSKYKLQFKGLEWWDNEKEEWSKDTDQLKMLLKD